MIAQNKRMLWILGSIAVLLSIPLIAMQFTNEIVWTGSDFLIMGFLLLGVGLMIEMVMRRVSKPLLKGAIILGIILLFLLVWAELAVGIFGSPVAGS